jgi:hypothetical protein
VYLLFLHCGVVCLGCWWSFCVIRCHCVSCPFEAVQSRKIKSKNLFFLRLCTLNICEQSKTFLLPIFKAVTVLFCYVQPEKITDGSHISI